MTKGKKIYHNSNMGDALEHMLTVKMSKLELALYNKSLWQPIQVSP